MNEITNEHILTVEKIRKSGLTYTLAERPPFLDILALYLGASPRETGVRVPPGNGKFARATRSDFAKAPNRISMKLVVVSTAGSSGRRARVCE